MLRLLVAGKMNRQFAQLTVARCFATKRDPKVTGGKIPPIEKMPRMADEKKWEQVVQTSKADDHIKKIVDKWKLKQATENDQVKVEEKGSDDLDSEIGDDKSLAEEQESPQPKKKLTKPTAAQNKKMISNVFKAFK